MNDRWVKWVDNHSNELMNENCQHYKWDNQRLDDIIGK